MRCSFLKVYGSSFLYFLAFGRFALKVLKIYCCFSISHEGIVSILHFPFLWSFKYLARFRVLTSFIVRIMSQNPSLKSVATNLEDHAEDVLKEVNNSRLTTLIPLVIYVYLNFSVIHFIMLFLTIHYMVFSLTLVFLCGMTTWIATLKARPLKKVTLKKATLK